ncbi:TPA: hypothetical protein ACXN37_000379 [Stenotrophomonas maltophilia]|uniref:hypothetical protein n=1 Tax=Stenotrophomonas maltophilia TaxID=40324 RepID=UPI0013DB9EA1|nr:hypothetical protein [Stenotrophomonas maltophilia]
MDRATVETEDFCSSLEEEYGELAAHLDEQGHATSAQRYWRLCYLWGELSKIYRVSA